MLEEFFLRKAGDSRVLFRLFIGKKIFFRNIWSIAGVSCIQEKEFYLSLEKIGDFFILIKNLTKKPELPINLLTQFQQITIHF